MAKISYPQTDPEKASVYLNCMFEIKQRVEAVNRILASGEIALFKQEISYLHLRHICELVAIACLAAQGDYQSFRAFTEEYSPAKIFKKLKTLYPHFFPQPCEVTSVNGGHHLEANAKPGAYTERDITRLWSDAGSHLHRASVKNYLVTTFRHPPSLDPIFKHLHGITTLLSSHVIPIQVGDTQSVMLYVGFFDEKDGGLTARFLRMDMERGEMTIEEYKSHPG